VIGKGKGIMGSMGITGRRGANRAHKVLLWTILQKP